MDTPQNESRLGADSTMDKSVFLSSFQVPTWILPVVSWQAVFAGTPKPGCEAFLLRHWYFLFPFCRMFSFQWDVQRYQSHNTFVSVTIRTIGIISPSRDSCKKDAAKALRIFDDGCRSEEFTQQPLANTFSLVCRTGPCCWSSHDCHGPVVISIFETLCTR